MFTRKTILGVVLLLCITLVVPALATTYYVDPNGNDSADGNTWATAFATIQKGITSANDGEPNNYAVIDINSGIYETGPITINNNNIELNFRENVEVLAKSNNDPNEPNLFANSELFKARNKSGILFDGNNTVFRMRKSEYTTVVQDVIALYSCSNVTILNLACKDGGEDGIYIGDANSGGLRCCQNISIKNVICDNNKRNAISVISVDGLTIEDCILKNTNGAAPECGIDLEPNYDIEQLMNIVVNNTRLENNASKALIINLSLIKNDINMVFENDYVTKGEGIYVAYADDNDPNGSIKFKNVIVEGTDFGTWIGKSSEKITLSFENCVWKDIAPFHDWYPGPITILSGGSNKPGGISFNNCQIFDNCNRPAIKFPPIGPNTLYDVNGTLYVHNDNRTGPLFDWSGAETNNVTIDVNRGFADLSWVFNKTSGNVYSSIQSALNDSNNSDEIEVYPGTYYEAIDSNGKTITLCSAEPNDLNVIKATIINGSEEANVVEVNSNATLKGLTITGGQRGVYCSASNPVISNCIIRSNTSEGIYADSATVTVKNSIIYNNDAGLIFQNANGIVRNNTIVNNKINGIRVIGDNGPSISNCILWNNNDDLNNCAATYSCIKDGNDVNGTGNISSDPCFVDADNNDFHIGIHSPCVDAGDSNGNYNGEADIDGQPRVMFDRVDMGADEFGFLALAYWKLDETSGITAYDSTGDNNGVVHGASWTDGQIDGALDFNGNGDYVDCTKPVIPKADFAVACWFNTDIVSGYRALISQYAAGQPGRFGFDLSNNKLFYRIGSDSDTGTTAISTGEWHFAVLTREGSNLVAYLDGAEEFTAIADEDLYQDANTLIGTDGYYPFDGKIDEVMIFDRSLSADYILYLYQEALRKKASNPNPANEATGVEQNVVISWSPGENAVTHDVYFGTSFDAVNNADICDTDVYMGNQDANYWDTNNYEPNGLYFYKTYYWRIDERNSNGTTKGGVWNFKTMIYPNLAHLWEFDETSGITAYDFNNSNGTFNGDDPCWTATNGVDFNGVSDYFSVSSLNGAYNANNNFTVAGWFKTFQPTGTQTIVGQWSNRTSGTTNVYCGWQVLVENNKLVARFGYNASTSDITGTSDVNDSNWHHFALVYPTKDANAVLYLDGSSQGTEGKKNFSIAVTRFRIGDGSYVFTGTPPLKGGPFCGTIDDVMIFNCALTANEVYQLYLAGR